MFRPLRLRATRRIGELTLGSAVGRDPVEVDPPGSEVEVVAAVEEAGKGKCGLTLFPLFSHTLLIFLSLLCCSIEERKKMCKFLNLWDTFLYNCAPEIENFKRIWSFKEWHWLTLKNHDPSYRVRGAVCFIIMKTCTWVRLMVWINVEPPKRQGYSKEVHACQWCW